MPCSTTNPQLQNLMETALRLDKKARRDHNHICTSTADLILPFAAGFARGTSAYEVVGWRDYA
jgi:hypothetical protein